MMRTFKDNLGREWSIDINVGAVKRVRDLAKIDLADFDAKSPGYVMVKLSDPVAMVDALWVIVSEQAAKAGVTQDAFAAGMGGDALGAAQDAMVECLADFCHGPRRNLLRAVTKSGREAVVILEARALTALTAPDAATRIADMIEAMARTGSTSPTSSPESSASTPRL